MSGVNESPDSPNFNKKIFFVVGLNEQVRRMIINKGHGVALVRHAKHDAVVFTGGEDVTPFLYGEKCHPKTKFSYTRDLIEMNVYHSTPQHIPKIGICRGAQFLNVMNGGRLWQHVNNHARPDGHRMKILGGDNRLIHVNSTHHQMMIPANSNTYTVLATANEATERECQLYGKNDKKPDWDDVEVLHYWSTHSLCYQPHPEYVTGENHDYFWDLVDQAFDWANPDAKAVSKVSKIERPF